MSNIHHNIKILRELKGLSQGALAAELDITRSRLGAYEEARNEPPIALLIQLADYFKISVDALLRANFGKTNPDSLLKIGKNRTLLPIVVDKEQNDQIEVIPQRTSAGYLNGYSDPEYIEKLPLMSLPFKAQGKLRAFPIKGDSMPPLVTGSYVIGRYVEQQTQLKNGNTYILLTKNEGLVYKRIYRKNTQRIELHSDNKNYDPYNIRVNEILEIWEFVCSLNVVEKQKEN